ncbi:50S ribosomal protein L17 [Candidatus Saccharibacteria bacterium]|nr:50S ribosomal protein L17 [Candidatus Saccharibacteria bacterium]
MPKHHKVYKLSRDSQARKALLGSLLQALIIEESITTTTQKAKFIKPEFDKLVTLAKKSSLSSRRRVYSRLGNQVIVDKFYQYLLPKLQSRTSGYTSLIHLTNRKGDNAQMAKIMIIFDQAQKSVGDQSDQSPDSTSDKSTKKADNKSQVKKEGNKS